MLPFNCDVKGEAYRRLIDYVMERSRFFVLANRYGMAESGEKVLTALKPFFIEKRRMGEMYPDNAIAYSEGTYYIYKCCSEAGEILKEIADGLFAWQNPNLPEDLCFWDERENDYLYVVAHEEMAGMNLDEAEAAALAKSIPGLFFRLPKYKNDFELFLDDAIYHQVSKLAIEAYGIQEIPDRISKLQSLKELTIFEQEVRRLPPALFDLTDLESLTIYTADLEGVPADIGRLINLKKLTICCGSYHSITDLSIIIPKEKLSLTQLPPEIGYLTNLEHLHISYTAITELPQEMESLSNLQSLYMNNNGLLKEPSFLERMTKLEQVNLDNNPFCDT
ncbi:MAG: leucine-rich repeat domain-containing protein [Bacillota bacterium]